jgi:putative membrane protein
MTRCLTAAALVLCGTVAFAQADRNRDRDQAGQGITAQDLAKAMTPPADSKEFAMRAAAGNLFEIRLSELAQQKAQSQEVKQLAQQLKQDHQRAQDQLKQAAQQAGANISEDLPKAKQVVLDAFQQLEGKAFDNAYTMCQVEGHLHSIMMYQNESQNGSDQQIKQYATQALPKLKQHAGQIVRVAQSMQIPVEVLATGGPGAGDTARPAGGTIRGDTDPNRTRTGTDRDKDK